jgi:hypothetical protein
MSYLLVVLVWGLLQAMNGAARPAAGVCDLLTAGDIERVQSTTVKEVKTSNEQRRGMHFGQCVYATADFAHSVSLTLITAASRGAVETYWDATFRERDERPERKVSRDEEDEPEARRIAGLGTDAFWTGDARAGALYVRRADVMLRISVGGVADEEERILRSRQLAKAALRRVR